MNSNDMNKDNSVMQGDEATVVDAIGNSEMDEGNQREAIILPTQTLNAQDKVQIKESSAGVYAGFWMRFWAYLLDLVVIGSIHRLIIYPVFRAMDVSLVEDGIFSPVSIATAVVFYLYFVLMTKYYGQTLGKMVFGLKVVEISGNRLSWGTVLFREWIGRFISATVIFLYIIVAFTAKKQGLHDIFADTTVIYEPR